MVHHMALHLWRHNFLENLVMALCSGYIALCEESSFGEVSKGTIIVIVVISL